MALPEQMADWPEDSFALLGLPYSCDARAARRAYLKLVRQFKPEHAPEQFQRIREAYDDVLRQLHWRRPTPLDPPPLDPPPLDPLPLDPLPLDPPPLKPLPPSSANNGAPNADSNGAHGAFDESDAKGADANGADANGAGANDPLPPLKPLASLIPPRKSSFSGLPGDRVDAAWKRAREGALPSAYRELSQLFEDERCRIDAALRLYWLLRADSALDSSRAPCEWLAAGLAFRDDGRLLELYVRELRRCPAEATAPHCSELLATDRAIRFGPSLYPIRWRSYLQQGRWAGIVEDLGDTAPRMVFQRDPWVRLLLAAMDCLAWAPDPAAGEAFQECRRQCESLVSLEQAELVERMDLLVEMTEGWRALRLSAEVPQAWSDLIRDSWLWPDESRAELLGVAVKMSEEAERRPLRLLRQLDHLRSLNSAAAAQFEELLVIERSLRSIAHRTDDMAAAACARFFQSLPRNSYSEARLRLLEFCRRESIDPRTVGEQVDVMIQRRRQAGAECWSELIDRDGPLKAIYNACRIAAG